MKQFLNITIIAILALCSLTANAYDFTATTEGGTKLYLSYLSDSTCTLTSKGGTPYCGDISIPSSVVFDRHTYRITAIASDAFLGCEELTSIELPEDIEAIGSCAFSCCNKLTNVVIPKSVTVIGVYAFSGCTSLKEIAIPENVTEICDFAFYGCSSLSSVTISGKPTSFGYNVFLDTEWWNNQEEGVVYYDDMLIGCHGDISQSITVKEGTRLIANGAFYNRCNITWVTLPQSIEKIGGSAFNQCSGLNTIILPSNLEHISEYTFYGCKNLTTVEMPKELLSIGWQAFSGCSSLHSIIIPDKVQDIGSEAFRGCINLINITSKRPTPPSCYTNAFTGVSHSNCTLYVEEKAVNSYLAARPWNEFNILVPGSEEEKEHCAKPFITVKAGKLSITSATQGATCHYTITSSDIQSSELLEGQTVALTGQYNVTAYAKAEGKLNSDISTAILVWVNPDEPYDKIIDLEQKKAVVLRTENDNAILCGTEYGENITLYTANGIQVTSLKAIDGETVIPYTLKKGDVYIIQYANRSIKFLY
ncbi:MAG: leucine-rich repeat domain-containing protein [Bacteroidaceae bacterium]|nr:leucine-rich repeat domain-containing protein [Bacteroidaceae bacterium]